MFKSRWFIFIFFLPLLPSALFCFRILSARVAQYKIVLLRPNEIDEARDRKWLQNTNYYLSNAKTTKSRISSMGKLKKSHKFFKNFQLQINSLEICIVNNDLIEFRVWTAFFRAHKIIIIIIINEWALKRFTFYIHVIHEQWAYSKFCL